ncbi:MAG: 1-acyl-sn-glycerol-3-phosphate acyltransferase [Alistipes sp.]|nr:1-acyl-sn-glycerol-3-phosphate acyltransferase [Alistipes sp.]
MDNTKFDDIRAYRDDEIPAAVERIASDPQLETVARFAFSGLGINMVKAVIRACKTTDQLQRNIMYPVIRNIINATTEGFSSSGVENISAQHGQMFISNHRDITCDAILMQYVLFDNNRPTTDIALGDNLMRSSLFVELCKANNMILVIRKDGASPREFLENSCHLSEYIRLRVTEDNRSVWIAQRNGRTKDGCDLTEPGLIKMLGMSGGSNLTENIGPLNICPVAISYQYEPCDILKAIELCRRRSEVPYQKRENEDLESIVLGIKQQKGRVHMSFCQPISHEDLSVIGEQPKTNWCSLVAKLMDERIHQAYHLFDTNYIAHDILHNENRFTDKYDDEALNRFAAHLAKAEMQFVEAGVDTTVAREIFLGIYANPVDAKKL